MAKRKEFEISGKINLTPNISDKVLKKLEEQIHGIVGTVNMEGIDRNHAQHQRELNTELRETNRLMEANNRLQDYYNRSATRQSRRIADTMRNYFPKEVLDELPGNYGVSASSRRQLSSAARGPQVPYNYVGALTSKSERDLRELHGSQRPIIYDEFLKSRGNVIDRSYIDKEGVQRIQLLDKGRELYEFLVQENVKNSRDLNSLIEIIKADPPGRFKQEILPALYNLLHMGVFSDTTFPSQLPRKYSGSNVPHSEMAEHIIRAITTSGIPLRMSNLTGGKTLEIGSYQRAMEYIKPLKVGGYLTQYQHDVDIHPLAALASPWTSFGWVKANSGVRPLTPLDNAYNFMSQMGYGNLPGYDLQRFDLKDITARQSYKTYSPKWKVESDKPPSAILPYGMSYVPLTTGFRRAIESFGPGIFNEETTANLSGQIYRFGGETPSWDYLTSRWRQDFDFSKYLAYRSDYDVLLHSNPTTEVQAARKHENWLFDSNLYDDSSTGRQFEMRQRMNWYGNRDILSVMPDQQNAQIVLTGIFDTLRKHFSYADRYGVHNSYSGLSNSDLLQLIEMVVIVARRATPTLFEEYDPSKPVPMNPMLGIHEFTSKAKTQDFLFLAELMQGVQLNALRDELYRFATIADKNASIQNLTLESLSDINKATANIRFTFQEADEAINGIRHTKSGSVSHQSRSQGYFESLRRRDLDKANNVPARINRKVTSGLKQGGVPFIRGMEPVFTELSGGLYSMEGRSEMFTKEQVDNLTKDVLIQAFEEFYTKIRDEVFRDLEEIYPEGFQYALADKITNARFRDYTSDRSTGSYGKTWIQQRALELANPSPGDARRHELHEELARLKRLKARIGSTLSDEELSYFALRVNKINEELGTLKNKFEFRLQPDTTFRGGFAYLGSAPSEESFDEEEIALKQRLASLISQEEYSEKYGRGNSFNYLTDAQKERSLQFRRRNQQEIIKLQGQLDILASKKQKFVEYSESPYDKELRELQVQRDSIDSEISDIRSSPFLPGESRDRRNARINSSYKRLTSEKEEINRKLYYLTLENDPIGNNTRPEELRHSETLPLTGFAVNEGEIGGSTSHGNRVFANRETSINKFGVAFDKLSAYAKLQEDIISKMKNNLKMMLPVIGVSLAAAALGTIFGAPELGAAPLMFAGLMKPQKASEKLESEGKKVYWDIDGTYLYNFLDQKFDEHTKLLGLDNFKTYNRANPLVNPNDIERVITARPEKYRDATLVDLARAGVFPKELLMRGDDSWDKEGSSQFKARALKEHGATHYVDDDMAYNAMLAPLLGGTISAISTNDFYNMAGQLSLRTDSFMNIGKLETSSVLDMLKQTLNSPKGKQLLRAALPIVLAGAFSAAAGISPDIAAMGAMPFAFMGTMSSDDTEHLRALYRQQLDDIATRKGELQRKRKLFGTDPSEFADIDAELEWLNVDRNRIGGLLGALPPEPKTTSASHASLLDYLPFQEGNNAYRFYASLGYVLKGSSKGQAGFPKEVEDIKSRYLSGASELDFFKKNPEQLKNLSAMISTTTDFNNPDYGGTLNGTVNLAASLDLGKDATQEMVDEIDRYNKGFVQASNSTNKFGESILMTKDSVEGTSKEINTLTKYSRKMGRLSWSFTMLSMNALGVFFSMMSINNMLMQGLNMVLTPLTDLDKMMQSYAMSQAFASKTGIDMNKIMKESGITMNDIVDGWETMTGFVSDLQFGLGMLGANILKDEDTFNAIQDAVMHIVEWLSDPETAKQLADVIENMADVLPQLVDALPTIISFVGLLTRPFNPDAKENDWIGNQSGFSLMLYGQIAAMFAMPILSIISLLWRIAQGILWLGGLISGSKLLGSGLGLGEGAMLGGGGTLAGSKIYQKLFGNVPKGGYATGAAEMEGLATREMGLFPRMSAMLTGPGAWMGKAAGPLGVLLTLLSMAEPVGGSSLMRTDTLGNVYYGKTEEEIKEKIKANGGTMWTPESGIQMPTPKYDNYPSRVDNNVPEWARGISDIDHSNVSDIYKQIYGTSNINFDQMGTNFSQNISTMKNATNDLAPAIAAFNGNPSFAGFERESGLDNVTFKQENHFEINVQGSLDDKSTPNLFSGLSSLLAGRWS